MTRFSANLSLLFTEDAFLDRFQEAFRAGFRAVEYMFPYDYEKGLLAEKLDRFNLTQVLINLPPGDWAAGERGIAVLPDRIDEFRRGVATAIDYAKALRCVRINCLAGNTPEGVEPFRVRQTLVDNLRFAADALAKEHMLLLLEALNPGDMPGFSLTHTRDAISIIEEADRPNILCQYDVYHMQVTEGNLTETIRRHIDRIGHIQIADVPGRHEPGTGEINFPNLFRFIEEAGYAGFIGCEYKPLAGTKEGMGWMKPYLKEG